MRTGAEGSKAAHPTPNRPSAVRARHHGAAAGEVSTLVAAGFDEDESDSATPGYMEMAAVSTPGGGLRTRLPLRARGLQSKQDAMGAAPSSGRVPTEVPGESASPARGLFHPLNQGTMYRQRLPLLSIVALLALASAPGRAQESPRFSGAWTLDREQSDDVDAKINTSIARMNIIVRQVARPRLRSTNIPYPRLIFSFGENVGVDMPGYPSVASPANGQPVFWHRRTGLPCTEMIRSCMVVTTTWEDRALVQTFRSEDGDRQNVFTVSPDGARLTMAVTLTSPRLPAPLAYRLVYMRPP